MATTTITLAEARKVALRHQAGFNSAAMRAAPLSAGTEVAGWYRFTLQWAAGKTTLITVNTDDRTVWSDYTSDKNYF